MGAQRQREVDAGPLVWNLIWIVCPAGTAPVLSSATLSGHPVDLITAEPRVAYAHLVAVSLYQGGESVRPSRWSAVRTG